jgi:CheY-like chemotaxis protein
LGERFSGRASQAIKFQVKAAGVEPGFFLVGVSPSSEILLFGVALSRSIPMNQPLANQMAYVIEDEINLAAIFAKALEKAGFNTLAIHDGQEALDHLRCHSPSLVILDLNLPLVSGKELLRYIRADARLENTRVILATSDSAAIAGELERNADLVLLKPISYTQLRDLACRFH